MKDKIGQYQIIRILGRGGMGAVYLAKDTLLEREVAIKTVQSHMDTSSDRFFQEARTLARLNHPNVGALYNLIQEDNNTFMVMEYINGIGLDDLIEAKGQLTVHQAKTIFMQILKGLEHAHEKGIIHRDIKSSNVMITERGVTKLMDFGIAVSSGNERYTRTGNILGTLEYISPEIIKGEQPSVQSDIYALGILLYEMVSGKTPFQGTNEYALINAHIEQKPPELGSHIPSSLKKVIKKCLAKSTDKRYSYIHEMMADMEAMNEEDPKGTLFKQSKSITSQNPGKSSIELFSRYKNQLIYGALATIIIICMALLIPKNTSDDSDGPDQSMKEEITTPSSKPALSQPVEIAKKDPIELKISQLIYEGQAHAQSRKYLEGNDNLLTTCQKIFDLDPRNDQARSWINEMINYYLRLGNEALRKDQYQEAIQYFRNVLSINPDNQEAKNQLFKAELRKNESKKKSNSQTKSKSVKPLPEKKTETKPRNIITPIKEDITPTVNDKIKDNAESESSKKFNNDKSSNLIDDKTDIIKERKTRKVPVAIPKNEDILLSVDKTISSDQNHRKGESISLSVLKDVYVNGILVIRAGGKGRAVLENFKSSRNNQKGLIELKVKEVQAVDGSWIAVKRGNFKIPGDKGKEIIFDSSTKLQVKTSKSININAYQ